MYEFIYIFWTSAEHYVEWKEIRANSKCVCTLRLIREYTSKYIQKLKCVMKCSTQCSSKWDIFAASFAATFILFYFHFFQLLNKKKKNLKRISLSRTECFIDINKIWKWRRLYVQQILKFNSLINGNFKWSKFKWKI